MLYRWLDYIYICKIKIITLFLQVVDILLPRNWNLEVQNKLWNFIFYFCLSAKNNFTDQSYNIAKCQLLFKLFKCFIVVTSFDVIYHFRINISFTRFSPLIRLLAIRGLTLYVNQIHLCSKFFICYFYNNIIQ